MPLNSLNAPNVHIREQSGLIAPLLSSANTIAAFVGYTQKGSLLEPTRIRSLAEYEKHFGQAEITRFTVTVTTSGGTTRYALSSIPALRFLMYHSIQFYFANGGGECYVVSVGRYTGTVNGGQLTVGLNTLQTKHIDLLLPVDAVQLQPSEYYAFCKAMLTQCRTQRDRFAVMDLQDKDTVTDFRNGIGTSHLDYGAVYTPYLVSTLRYNYNDDSIEVTIDGDIRTTLSNVSQNGHIHKVRALLDKQRVTLPPSSAVAGIYAQVDQRYGLWKSPANVSIQAVTEPSRKYSDEDQASLNVDAASGKSINAIRAFHNKGIWVWGARTLDGKSHDWRYVATKRLLMKIEKDLKDITSIAINEANIPRIWTKLKTLIEGYLDNLWQKGALSGSKANQAYFVQIGLGETMTPADLLTGDLKVTVGVATSRPAEFVVIAFTHKT